jgi:hypothetical protein
MAHRISRRAFLSSSAAAGVWITGVQRGYGQEGSPNAKLNLAVIACGGRGGANLDGVKSETIVALCDINEASLEKAGQKHPGAKKYVDFRKLFEAEKAFDGVVVSTAEHTHAFATLPALKLKKHVYCEKPLTHGVWEARVIAEAAKSAGVATQMGIQIHATENYRRVVELVRSGAIGPVREAHVWTARSWGWQTAEDAQKNGDMLSTQERPADEHPVPAGVHWDLFVGPAPARPFNKIYYPGPRWYRWWDFGSGTMSDLGSHMNDLPFWALQLDAPLTVEGFGPPVHAELAPANFRAVYEFGARGELPPVKLTWYQGTEQPPALKEGRIPPNWKSGCLFVGDKGMILADYGKHVLLPEADFKDFKRPDPSIPRTPGHHAEWITAAKTGKKSLADFAYAGPLTESNHLASIAYRVGKKLEWDSAALKAKNAPEADRLIKREYRKGWELA